MGPLGHLQAELVSPLWPHNTNISKPWDVLKTKTKTKIKISNRNQWQSMKINENQKSLNIAALIFIDFQYQSIAIDFNWLLLIILIIDSHWLESSGVQEKLASRYSRRVYDGVWVKNIASERVGGFFPLFHSLYFSLVLHYLNAWNKLLFLWDSVPGSL